MIVAPVSTRAWAASESSASEPDRRPATSLPTVIPALARIENSATRSLRVFALACPEAAMVFVCIADPIPWWQRAHGSCDATMCLTSRLPGSSCRNVDSTGQQSNSLDTPHSAPYGAVERASGNGIALLEDRFGLRGHLLGATGLQVVRPKIPVAAIRPEQPAIFSVLSFAAAQRSTDGNKMNLLEFERCLPGRASRRHSRSQSSPFQQFHPHHAGHRPGDSEHHGGLGFHCRCHR